MLSWESIQWQTNVLMRRTSKVRANLDAQFLEQVLHDLGGILLSVARERSAFLVSFLYN